MSVSELHDILALRGVNQVGHRLTVRAPRLNTYPRRRSPRSCPDLTGVYQPCILTQTLAKAPAEPGPTDRACETQSDWPGRLAGLGPVVELDPFSVVFRPHRLGVEQIRLVRPAPRPKPAVAATSTKDGRRLNRPHPWRTDGLLRSEPRPPHAIVKLTRDFRAYTLPPGRPNDRPSINPNPARGYARCKPQGRVVMPLPPRIACRLSARGAKRRGEWVP